ncbi:MAG: hypothetical protein H6Q05_1298 [Acidobacteria bacterium]|nr:hypothetical protein [Acidobacteriota bacterium]
MHLESGRGKSGKSASAGSEAGAKIMAGLLQDLRYGFRQLGKSPGFLAVAIAIMGLGIGVNTAIFSLINTVLFCSIPYRDPAGVIRIYTKSAQSPDFSWMSYREFCDHRDGTDVFSTAAIASDGKLLTILSDGKPGVATGEFFSEGFLSLLDFSPTIGRVFMPAENEPGSEPVVIISHSLWQRRYGADPNILGLAISMNGHPVTVIGVGPKGFRGTLKIFTSDYWMPLGTAAVISPINLESRDNRDFRMFARMKPGIAIEQAEARLNTLAANLAMDYPETNKDRRAVLFRATEIWLDPLVDKALVPVSAFLLVVVGLVLVVACSNLAGLLLMRASSRLKEVAIRLAIGAGRRRIVRQFLTESALLGLMGGAFGLIVALWLADAFSTLNVPLPVSLQIDMRLDWRVLLYAIFLSIATGIFFGLAPALKATRRDIIVTIKDDAPSLMTERRRFNLRNILVVAQVVVSVVLLAAGGLFVRGMGRGLQADPGFQTEHTAIAAIDVEVGGYQEESAGRAFYQRYVEKISSLPGVQTAALASRIPFGLWGNRKVRIRLPGKNVENNEQIPRIDYAAVTLEYFGTMDIPILLGRNFALSDTRTAPRVAIVSEAMARRFWGSASPVGMPILLGGMGREESIEVVGVARDVYLEMDSIRGESIPFLYLPFAQSYSGDMIVIARTFDTADGMPEKMLRELRALDARVPALEAETMKEHLQASFFMHRAIAVFLAAFGILTLILAGIGLYGLVAFSVSQRMREMGIRIALGAQATQVVRMVLSQAIWLIIAGLIIGLPLAGLVMYPLSKALLGVSAFDPLTFAGIALLLAAVAVLAGYVPARRATRLDPMAALRNE